MHIQKHWTDFLGGSTRFDLMDEGRSLSHIEGVVPFTLRFGNASVHAVAVAGVATEEDCRRRGYARRVMEAALDYTAQGDAAISFLHGIRDFYHRFGYVPGGPSYELSLGTTVNAAFPMPDDCHVRLCMEEDLTVVQALYQTSSRYVIGAAVRPPDGFVWGKLKASLAQGECRVVEECGGKVVAYAWLARDCWAVRAFASGRDENAFVVGEVMALDHYGAAGIAACHAWAEEEEQRRGVAIHQVVVPLPPVGAVPAASRFQHSLSYQRYQPNGGFMARILSIERLLDALAPELRRRVQDAGLTFSGALVLRTEIGEATLRFGSGTLLSKQTVVITLHQTTLVRLIFGAMPSDDVLHQDGIAVTDVASQLLRVLFPTACPHIYLPDQC